MEKRKMLLTIGSVLVTLGIIGVVFVLHNRGKIESFAEIINEFEPISELIKVDGDTKTVISDREVINDIFELISDNCINSYRMDTDLSAPPPGGEEIIFTDGEKKYSIYMIYDPEYLPCDLALRIVEESIHETEVICFDMKQPVRDKINELTQK